MTPEGRVKAAIGRVLDKYAGLYHFMPVQTGRGKRALDYLLCVNGYFLAIEAKAPGKRPTDLQEDALEEITLAGGATFVVDNTEHAKAALPLILNFLLAIPTRQLPHVRAFSNSGIQSRNPSAAKSED